MRVLVFAVASPEDMDRTAERVFRALGVDYRERNSSYFGGRYFRAGNPRSEEIYFFVNRDIDGSRQFPEAAETEWILRIDKTSRTAPEVLAQISGPSGIQARLLRER